MPFTWDVTKPAGTDPISQGDDQIRADKDTLRKVLGTLTPYGVTTTSWRAVQVGDDTWLAQNLYFDGTNWNRDDTTKASVALGLRANGTVTVHKVAAGANPVGASLPSPVATLDATSLFNAIVAGTDPGGTEVLRAQNLRASGAIFSTVVVGTDPGGTESLRAQSLRAGSGVVGTWRPVGVIRPTTNVTSVVFSGLGLSPPALLRLVAVIRPSSTGSQSYHLRVNSETSSADWTDQLLWAYASTVVAERAAGASRIAYCDNAGAFSVTHCSVVIAVAGNGGVRASSMHSFADTAVTPTLLNFGLVKSTTISELSSLSVVGPIAAGSVFYLEYLGP